MTKSLTHVGESEAQPLTGKQSRIQTVEVYLDVSLA
jgi:hypothetical protein